MAALFGSALGSGASPQGRAIAIRTDVRRLAIHAASGGAPGSADPSLTLLALHESMYSALATKAQLSLADAYKAYYYYTTRYYDYYINYMVHGS